MSTINGALFENFFYKVACGKDLTASEAQSLGLDKEFAELTEELDVNTLDLDDIKSSDLEEALTMLFVAEQEKKTTAKNEEEEKRKQTEVNGKNGAGV